MFCCRVAYAKDEYGRAIVEQGRHRTGKTIAILTKHASSVVQKHLPGTNLEKPYAQIHSNYLIVYFLRYCSGLALVAMQLSDNILPASCCFPTLLQEGPQLTHTHSLVAYCNNQARSWPISSPKEACFACYGITDVFIYFSADCCLPRVRNAQVRWRNITTG
jgi:hypothetical protein